MSTQTYTTPADILANAVVSDSPEIMELDQLDALTQIHIVTARLQGYQPVSVRWPGGLFVLMFCEPGCQWPDPQNVIRAYHHCLETKTTFPAGECK